MLEFAKSPFKNPHYGNTTPLVQGSCLCIPFSHFLDFTLTFSNISIYHRTSETDLVLRVRTKQDVVMFMLLNNSSFFVKMWCKPPINSMWPFIKVTIYLFIFLFCDFKCYSVDFWFVLRLFTSWNVYVLHWTLCFYVAHWLALVQHAPDK